MNYLHFLTFSYIGHKDIFCICSLIIGTLELQLLSNLISFLFNLSFKYKVIDSSPLKGAKCSFVPNILYFEVIFNFSNYMREQCKDDKKLLHQDSVKVSVILHNVLSSSLEDLIKSCNSFHAFILASRISSCSLRTSSTCLLSASMPRVGFFSCEYNSV